VAISTYGDNDGNLKRLAPEGKEFHPASYEEPLADLQDPSLLAAYDAYSLQSAYQGLNPTSTTIHNPYLQDPYSNQNYFSMSSYAAPLQHHLYAPLPPHRENLHGFQRMTHDFFVPEDLRREYQRRLEATLQVMPNSRLLPNLEHFHSLVPLDENSNKVNSLFDYQTWIYKATSSKDGKTYAIRRIAGYRLTNELAIRALIPWKRIDNGGLVTIHDVFTTRAFGDSSLLFITDYHPCSETLSEHHVQRSYRNGHHKGNMHTISEHVLWSYIVQIASALKPIHSSGLAARIIHPSKILITSKNRIRLNACGMLDVIKFDSAKSGLQRSSTEDQQKDLEQLGRLIVALAVGNTAIVSNFVQVQQAFEAQFSSSYSDRLQECIAWLISPPKADQAPKELDTLLAEISTHTVAVLDNFLHEVDTQDDVLATCIEDGRITRLLFKLNMVLERPENDHANQGHTSWSAETGDRYYLRLFRDYVFHAVDANGRPITDLSHVLNCLNRLDAGTADQILLSSRDGDTVFEVTFKEIKRVLESAFNELLGMNSGPGPQSGRETGKGRKTTG
jgi:PAB-dependent poly(A)-specific ribonuclease subunit 3